MAKASKKKRKTLAKQLANAFQHRKGIAKSLLRARRAGLTESQIMHIEEHNR